MATDIIARGMAGSINKEIDSKIDASHCYLIGDDDLNVDTGKISSRFKNIIDNRATFKYVGTDNSAIIKVNNSNAINKTFIPIEDKDADHNGFYLYQTTYISVDTAKPEISIIRFYVSNSNILTTVLDTYSSFGDMGYISPQIMADTDDYIYLDQEGILYIPNLLDALVQEIGDNYINGTKIFNFQLLDNNNLINTLPEDTKIFLGNPDSTILPLLDLNSNVNFNTGKLIAPIMTVGSIKRFRICDDDPVLKDSYIFSGYIYSGGKGIVVITERSSGESEALYELDMSVSTYDNNSNLIDDNVPLKVLIYESNFERFKIEASRMGLTINTPNDLVTLINTLFVMTTGHQISSISPDVPAVLLGLLVLQADKAYGSHSGFTFDVVSENFYNIVNPLDKGIPYIHLLTDPLEYAYGINVNGSCTLTEYRASGGSSSGGSGSGETLKILNIDGAFINDDILQIGITSTNWTWLLNLLSQGMGTTITEDNIQTVWTNGSDYEKLTFIGYALFVKSFSSYGSFTVCSAKRTTTEIDGVTITTSLALVEVDETGVRTSTTNKSDLSSSTLSITTIGGGNGGSSADSNNAYKIVFSAEKDETYTDNSNTTQTASLKRDFEIIILKNQEQEIVSQVNSAMQTNFTSINEIAQMINQQISTLGNTDSSVLQLYGQSIYILGAITKILIYFTYDIVDGGNVETSKWGATLYEILNKIGLGNLALGTAFTRVSNVVVSDYSFGGGGSSTSESYYKIVLENFGRVGGTKLTIFIYKEDLTPILTAINQQMGTNLKTASDLVDAYNTVKLDSNNAQLIATMFTTMASLSLQNNLNNFVIGIDDIDACRKIIETVFAEIICGNNVKVFDLGADDGADFTASTLTITEVNNQKI